MRRGDVRDSRHRPHVERLGVGEIHRVRAREQAAFRSSASRVMGTRYAIGARKGVHTLDRAR
jgi:hypothetical protein